MVILNTTETDVLLHELFHVYPYQTIGVKYSALSTQDIEEIFCLATANYEVEAQMARYIYGKRNAEYFSPTSKWYKDFHYVGETDFTVGKALAFIIDQKMQGLMNEKKFGVYFSDICKNYVKSKEKDEKDEKDDDEPKVDYKYNPSLTIQENIGNLSNVSINC